MGAAVEQATADDTAEMEAAALKIQAIQRGHHARREVAEMRKEAEAVAPAVEQEDAGEAEAEAPAPALARSETLEAAEAAASMTSAAMGDAVEAEADAKEADAANAEEEDDLATEAIVGAVVNELCDSATAGLEDSALDSARSYNGDEDIGAIQEELDNEMSRIMNEDMQTLTDDERAQAKALFDEADKDSSGALDVHELHILLGRLGIHIDPSTVLVYAQMLLKDFDANANDRLEWDEFQIFYVKALRTEAVRAKYARRITRSMEREHMAESKKYFEKYDADRSGFIDLEELEALLRESLQLDLEPEKFHHFVQDVFTKADLDNSGTIDEEEFLNLYRKCLANEDVVRQYEERVRIRYTDGHWTWRG